MLAEALLEQAAKETRDLSKADRRTARAEVHALLAGVPLEVSLDAGNCE
jgi:hypothetical protein